eukprot:Opistho-1_new@31007
MACLRLSIVLAALCALATPIAASSSSSESTMLAVVSVTGSAPFSSDMNVSVTLEVEGIYGTFCRIVPVEGLLVAAVPASGCGPIENAPKNGSWIAIVMRADRNCTFYTKAMNAFNAGAAGVIIVNDDPTRVVIMAAQSVVPIPVVSVSLSAGNNILGMMNQSNGLRGSVAVGPELSLFHLVYSRLFLDVAIFFIVFCVVTVLTLGVYYYYRRRQLSELARRNKRLANAAKEVVKSLPVRRFVASSHSEGCNAESCAICLDEYTAGQELRILPCQHEFCVACIDPWLLEHWTCPLCKLNILGEQHEQIANGSIDPEIAFPPAIQIAAVQVTEESSRAPNEVVLVPVSNILIVPVSSTTNV